MPRLIILGVVLAVAFTLYSLVDAAMTDPRRIRGVSKPVWVVICVLLPVIGGILWFVVGKGDGKSAPKQARPDSDPHYGAMSPDNVDERIAGLEAQLRALDDEVFPGEPDEPGLPDESPATDETHEPGEGDDGAQK